jgi:hypothetical protein
MRIRENLGGILASNNKGIIIPTFKPQIGKVYGIITTENTPTKELFDKYGGWSGIGTIFYLDYDNSKNIDKTDLTKCKVARPFDSHIQAYPLIGELVQLTDGPAPTTQIDNTSSQKYYIGVINLWNNNQQNSPSGDTLGKTFNENADVRNLLSFEGDRIYQGRKGNGIRFGSTVKNHSDINEWSSGEGNDGDPITILVNGYVTTDKKSITPNIEEINKELSSIYLTSTQKIPLQPDRKNTLNPLTQPLLPEKYLFSQVILNSDRITLNSKKDEVMLFAKTNIELNTNNIINLNAGKYVHLNSPNISLGTKSDGTLADEPLLLGNKTKDVLTQFVNIIGELCNALSSVVSTSEGSPLVGVNTAGASAVGKLESLQNQLKDIVSTHNYTI